MKIDRRRFVAVLTLLLTAAVVGIAAAAGPPAVPPGLQRAIAAQEAHSDSLLTKAGVVGTAVGLAADGRHVVKIYTESAAVRGLPSHLDGVPVEVEVTGELVAQASPIGVSTGTERLIIYRGWLYCTVGTIAARVTDGTNVYALSNAHVYALEGSSPQGTVVTGANGDRILAPGRVDMTAQACGSAQEINNAVIGRLANYVPIDFSKRGRNTVDAALALTSTAQLGTSTPAGGYGTPTSTTLAPALGQQVQKLGRTTGLTLGTVTGINATVSIRYDKGSAKFVGQAVIQGSSGAFSDSGDSGSLIVTQNGNVPVALLFAGSSQTTIGNPIDLVLDALNVTIDGAP